jgi:hypothetical protein
MVIGNEVRERRLSHDPTRFLGLHTFHMLNFQEFIPPTHKRVTFSQKKKKKKRVTSLKPMPFIYASLSILFNHSLINFIYIYIYIYIYI